MPINPTQYKWRRLNDIRDADEVEKYCSYLSRVTGFTFEEILETCIEAYLKDFSRKQILQRLKEYK